MVIRKSWRTKSLILWLSWWLLALACGAVPPQYQFNNAVRLAVYEYERKTYGPVDDLVIHFNRDEPRTHFEAQNQNGGRTVWLPGAGAEEYFALRPPERSYLYIQEIEYNPERSEATVKVYRGDGAGYQGWQLTLRRGQNNGWSVRKEVELNR